MILFYYSAVAFRLSRVAIIFGRSSLKQGATRRYFNASGVFSPLTPAIHR
jgi:hypothetical protein